MSRQLRTTGRIESLLGVTAVIAALAMAAPSPGQFGEAAGFTEIMAPYYLRRDLVQFEQGLGLDDGQSAILQSIYWDYEDEQNAGKTAMFDRLTAMREKMEGLGQDQIMKLVFQPFEERIGEWDRNNERFLQNVQAIISTEQLEQWPKFRRSMRREKQLPKGRFSGERVDLFHVVRQMDPDESTQLLIESALDDYELSLDEALTRRINLHRDSRLTIMRSLREQDSATMLPIYARQIDAAKAVRMVNDHYIEVIAAALPGKLSAKFRQTALELGYPRVYRPTAAHRLFAKAKKLKDLPPDTLQAIEDLEEMFLAEIAVINSDIMRLIQEQEPADARYRAEVASRRGAGSPVEKEPDRTREGFRRRDELVRRYLDLLEDLLTPEQLLSLRGPRRRADQNINENIGKATGTITDPAAKAKAKAKAKARKAIGGRAPGAKRGGK